MFFSTWRDSSLLEVSCNARGASFQEHWLVPVAWRKAQDLLTELSP